MTIKVSRCDKIVGEAIRLPRADNIRPYEESEIRDLVVFELQLKLIGDEGDEFTIGGLAFCIRVGNSSTNKEKPRNDAV